MIIESRAVRVFFVWGLFAITLFPARSVAAAVERRSLLNLVSADFRQVTFELVCGPVNLTDGADGTRLQLPGTEQLSRPGEPDLPGQVVLVGIPQTGGVRLTVQTSGTEELRGVHIRPAQGFSETAVGPAEIYRQDRFWPFQPAELVNIEILRSLRVARVILHPCQFNPVKRVVQVHRQVRVTVLFDQPAQEVDRPEPFDNVLERLLVNGAQAIGWKLDPPIADTSNFFDRSDVWCRVKTETTGVYRLFPNDLKAAGFDPTVIDPTTFRLFTLGRYTINGPYPDTMVEVPVYVAGEADGRFDAKDYLAFYAQAPSHWDDTIGGWQPNLFTNYNCYWLTWGGAAGRRMSEVSGAGATSPADRAANKVHLEQDNLCPARSGLLWLWEKDFKEGGRQSAMFYHEFRLPGRDTIKELRLRLYGRFARNETLYHVVVYLNGVLLDTVGVVARSSGAPANNFRFDSLPIAAAAPPLPVDTLALELIGDAEEEIYLDFIEASYVERLAVSAAAPFVEFFSANSGMQEFSVQGASGDVLLLDVTDPWAPRRITGSAVSGNERRFRYPAIGQTRYACVLTAHLRSPTVVARRTPGGLRSLNEPVDYYIICPDEFYPAAKLLAQYREGNVAGLANARCRAVRLSEVFDDYAFGMEEPGAIKQFFGAKRPGYGLLAGDATYDYRNNLKVQTGPGVPAYEVGFDLDPEVYGGIAKTYDAWFADFEGNGSSPDMILGRVTCRSAIELRRFLDKVRLYEKQQFGLWAKRFLLLADDEYEGDPSRPDPIRFQHIYDCEEMLPLVGDRFDPVKVYLTEYPREGSLKPKAKEELFRQLESGALLWAFFGHGAGFQLCHERVLHIDDVPQVHNGSRNPVAFYGSCGVGRFDDTKYQAIAEELVRKEDGCIATMAASKATDPGGNLYFARLLFPGLVNDSAATVGTAFYQAWTRANTLYHLFGDPATRVKAPGLGVMPQVSPDTFYPGGRILFQDSVPVGKGSFEVRAAEAEKERRYRSDQGETFYQLPGNTIFRGRGSFEHGRLTGSFVVPKLAYPDTVIVPNGTYVRRANSCRVSIVAWQDSLGFSSRKADIPLSKDTAVTVDHEPPDLALWADHIRLLPQDTTAVPKDFHLVGMVSDESGILLAPDPDYGLSFYVRDRSNRVELADYFQYNANSTTTGQFRYSVELQNVWDSIVVTVSDNFLNRLRATFFVNADLSQQLRLDSCLVYPNPTKGPARFTFELSRAALVSVKIYTISGRLVRALPPQPCQFGYNQIEWDGRDRFGAPLANGVYLYKLDAQVREGTAGLTQSYSTSFRDRFLVHH